MAKPPSAPRFADLLRNEGLTVVEVGNWEDHNRNHKGPWGSVHGVTIHHTVTKGYKRTVDPPRRALLRRRARSVTA
ncbi:N-acetylmuramoyl-L-alanine amidase OS=Streptomyces alboniger OX=132473 GN=CP975_23925 PE=4 SV=1 [Streptomyces alboniger]